MASRALVLFLFLLAIPDGLAQQPAPPFSGSAINVDRHINLDEFSGKVVFLDFWASWCPPCLASLPAYDRLRSEIGIDSFEIIAVNVDEDLQDALDFLAGRPVSYPVLHDPEGEIGIPYGIRTLPASFLIDGQGRIVSQYRSYKPGDEASLKQEILELVEVSTIR